MRNASGLLIDTNIVIDYLRNRALAVAYLETVVEQQPLLLSVTTVAELYAGVREGRERAELKAALAVYTLLPIDEMIATQTGLLLRQYTPSHALQLGDALIAATAQHHQLTLVTLNRKHFPMLADVRVPY